MVTYFLNPYATLKIMRYTHSFKIIRKRRHAIKISVIITAVLLILILILGFTTLDASIFFSGFFESLLRVVIAYILSLVLALIIAIIVNSSKTIEGISVPILDVMQSFPSFALFPLLALWFGKTAVVTIIILVITMIWPILFTILSAQKGLREDLLEAASIFGAKGYKYLVFVLLPLMFPAIITGSIVAWGEAWEAIIAAEIIVGVPGVGTYLAQTGESVNSKILIIGITLLLMILFILNKYIWLPLLNMSTKYQQDA